MIIMSFKAQNRGKCSTGSRDVRGSDSSDRNDPVCGMHVVDNLLSGRQRDRMSTLQSLLTHNCWKLESGLVVYSNADYSIPLGQTWRTPWQYPYGKRKHSRGLMGEAFGPWSWGYSKSCVGTQVRGNKGHWTFSSLENSSFIFSLNLSVFQWN